MKPALALEPVHWQGEVVGHIRRLAVLALKDGRRPTKERAGENRCGRRTRPRGQIRAWLKERYRNDRMRNLELRQLGVRPFLLAPLNFRFKEL